MAIEEELRSKVRRLFYRDHYTINAISQAEGLHPDTVKAVLKSKREEQGLLGPKTEKSSILDDYHAEIKEKLEHYPKMCATRLLQILRDKGFSGSIQTLRRHLKKVRGRITKKEEAHIFMHVNKGEQGQVDWAHFGELKIGETKRKLYLFVMVISWSRAIFARFTFDMGTSSFLALHEKAFQAFNGIPRVILYDNLKSVVIARRGQTINFNKDFLEFSGYHCFEGRACNPRRGNEKGRVERSIQYIRDNFFCARQLTTLENLNAELSIWIQKVSFQRPWKDNREYSVQQAFAEEEPFLMRLPVHLFDSKRTKPVCIGKRPYAMFDGNQYSLPPECVKETLNLSATDHEIVFFRSDKVMAKHSRCWEKGKIIELKSHMDELKKCKRSGSAFVAREAICQRIKTADSFLEKSIIKGLRADAVAREIDKLSDQYSDDVLDLAIQKCLEHKTISIQALRHYAHFVETELGIPNDSSVYLPNMPEGRNLFTKSQNLEDYDHL